MIVSVLDRGVEGKVREVDRDVKDGEKKKAWGTPILRRKTAGPITVP